jgi:hypothetical protein
MKKFLFVLLSLFASAFVSAQSTDNFDDRIAPNNLAGSGNWLEASGPNDGFKAYNPVAGSGEIYCNQSGSMAVYYSGTFDQDQYSQGVYVVEVINSWIGVGINLLSTGGGSGYHWESDASGSYFVKVVEGVTDWDHMIDGASWVPGHTYKLERSGSTLSFYDNGVLSNFNTTGTWVDSSPLTGGNPGFVGYIGGGVTTGTRIDYWQGGNTSISGDLSAGIITDNQSLSYNGDPVLITSVSDATGGIGSYTYKWQISITDSIAGSGTWSDIASSNSTTWDLGPQMNTIWIVRQVDDGSNILYSNVLKITIAAEGGDGGDEGGGSTTISQYPYPFNVIRDAKMSHDQDYIIPHPNFLTVNDYVGQFYPNCTDSVFMHRVPSYLYAIVSGDNELAFKISTTGMIQINNPSKVYYGTRYRVGIQISDAAGTLRNEIFYASIRVTHTSVDSVSFCNPSATVSGTGTFSSPYTYLQLENLYGEYGTSSVPSGHTIFIKRGQSEINPYYYLAIKNVNNPTKWTSIAAYGQGARPVFNGATHSVYYNAVMIGNNWAFDVSLNVRTRKVALYDLEFKGYTAVYTPTTSFNEGVHMSPACQYIYLNRLKIAGTSGNACMYFQRQSATNSWWRSYSIVKDCEVYNQTIGSHGIKLEAGGITLINCWGSGNTNGHFIDLTVWTSNNAAYYIWGNNNGTRAILIRHSKATIRWFVLRGSGAVVTVDQCAEAQFHPDSCSISDGYIVSNGYPGVDFYREDATVPVIARADTVQRCVFRSVSGGGVGIQFPYYSNGNSNSGSVIRQNSFTGPNYTGILVGSSSVTNLRINNNLFHDITVNPISITASGTGNKILNNTLYGNTGTDVSNTSGVAWVMTNNSYEDRTAGTWTGSNNYVYSSGDPYKNKAQNDFSPSEGSYLRDHGIDVQLARDLYGTYIPQNSVPDIGAIEYVVTTTPPVSGYNIGRFLRKNPPHGYIKVLQKGKGPTKLLRKF